MASAVWQEKDWRNLATVRKDIRFQRKHPLNLQWAGDLKIIQRQLEKRGWQTPVSAQSLQLLQWFNPKPDDHALPLLPQVHDGHYDVLRMVKLGEHGPRFIRLWQTNISIQQTDKQIPLWVGSVGKLYRQQVMGLTLFRTSTEYASVSTQFQAELTRAHPQLTIRAEPADMNGQMVQILLLNNK